MAGKPRILVPLSDYHGQDKVSVDVRGRKGEGKRRLKDGVEEEKEDIGGNLGGEEREGSGKLAEGQVEEQKIEMFKDWEGIDGGGGKTRK